MSGRRILFTAGVALAALAAGYRLLRPASGERSPSARPDQDAAAESPHPSLLYGRIATVDGKTFEGRLRWGGGQEAFWGDYFNGKKKENPWAAHVPPGRLPSESSPLEVFGIEIFRRERPLDVSRLFMTRFGDIARIEAAGRDVRVVLKSGAAFDLDRLEASDFDDGVRVWDAAQSATDLDSLRVQSIDMLPAPGTGAAPSRLHGTVRTMRGEAFTGFVQWDREKGMGSDRLEAGERTIRFDAIRSIVHRSADTAQVTLLDGADVLVEDPGGRGVYVDDTRFGRVLISWNAFERIDFSPGGAGPTYADFPAGGPLTGSVTTRDGRRLAGRLVYDLDESEVTETLDAPWNGVDYTIPFGLISAIGVPAPEERESRPAAITLHGGKQMPLQCAGDLGRANAGLLIFTAGAKSPEYVAWSEVGQIALDRPAAMYPR